jgi:hypothetical protein
MSEQARVNRQSPVPTSGPEGSDLRSIANQIEGLLDDEGHFGSTPDRLSRGHPDYDPSQDPRETRRGERDEKGRFKAKQAAEAIEESVETDEPEMDESDTQPRDERTEDTEQEQRASDTDDSQDTPAVDDAPTQEPDTNIHTLAELAEALEVTPDELKASIQHTFRAADEDITVTLAELEKGYQKDADYRRQTGQLAEARRQAEAEYQARMQQFEQANHIAAQNFQVAEQLLAAELNDPRLAHLRDSDPAEWTARREEIGQRVNALRQQRQQAAQQYEQFVSQQQGELRQREMQFLQQKLPDFGQQHVQQARSAMSSLGYSDTEIGNILDHRLVLGALELATLRAEVEELRALKTRAADTVKRVKKDLPKLQKPGKQTNRSKSGIRKDNVQRLKERARRSGSVEDAARVIENFI